MSNNFTLYNKQQHIMNYFKTSKNNLISNFKTTHNKQHIMNNFTTDQNLKVVLGCKKVGLLGS